MIDTFILIGMAGVGKTTIGQAVSKHLSVKFFDIDQIISQKKNATIPNIIKQIGESEFHKLESEEVLNHLGSFNIISTGGSFIYSKKTIETIKNQSLFILLDDTAKRILNRIPDLNNRGITGLNNKTTFEDIYHQRKPLYKKHANVTFSLNNKSFSDVTNDIINYLELIIN